MASLEQLQMLNDDDSSTSSSSSSTSSDNQSVSQSLDAQKRSGDAVVSVLPSLHPKKRIKLSLGAKFRSTISPNAERQDDPKPGPQESNLHASSPNTKLPKLNIGTKTMTASKTGTISDPNKKTSKPKLTLPLQSKKTPAVKPNKVTSASPKSPNTTKQSPSSRPSSIAPKSTLSNLPAANRKRTSIRSVRIAPLSSPGLWLARGNAHRGPVVDETSMISPNIVFEQAMASAGYTTESRSQTPHRGSSVERVVDDMFDSDVKFCLQFPSLVPQDCFVPETTATDAASKELPTNGESDPKAPSRLEYIAKLSDRLIQAFRKTPANETGISNLESKNGRRIPRYSDMAPVSLLVHCTADYMSKRMEYIGKVNERERAIVDYQKKQEAIDAIDPDGMAEPLSTDSIPPIPVPPTIGPESISSSSNEDAMESTPSMLNSETMNHRKTELTKHLDTRCFRPITGRYFGLKSNAYVDPYFYGPSAPGLGGLNFSTNTGLATASTGGGSGSLGGPLLMPPPTSTSKPTNPTTSVLVTSTKAKGGAPKVENKSTAKKTSPKASVSSTTLTAAT